MLLMLWGSSDGMLHQSGEGQGAVSCGVRSVCLPVCSVSQAIGREGWHSSGLLFFSFTFSLGPSLMWWHLSHSERHFLPLLVCYLKMLSWMSPEACLPCDF